MSEMRFENENDLVRSTNRPLQDEEQTKGAADAAGFHREHVRACDSLEEETQSGGEVVEVTPNTDAQTEEDDANGGLLNDECPTPSPDAAVEVERVSESRIEGGAVTAEIPFREIVEESAQLVDDAQTRFGQVISVLERCKNLSAAKKTEIRGILVPIMQTVSRQHGWLSQQIGKAPQTGRSEAVSRDVGVGRTPKPLSRVKKTISKGVGPQTSSSGSRKPKKGPKPSAEAPTEVTKTAKKKKPRHRKKRIRQSAEIATDGVEADSTPKQPTKRIKQSAQTATEGAEVVETPTPKQPTKRIKQSAQTATEEAKADRTPKSAEEAPKKANSWATVVTKSAKKKLRKMEMGGIPKGGQSATSNTPVSHDSARQGGKPNGRSRPAGSKAAKQAPPKRDFALLVRPKGAAEQAEANSDFARKLVVSSINPVEAKIAVKGMRPISGGGLLLLANSAADLERLEAEMEKKGLTKDLVVQRPQRRQPEIVLFGIDPDLPSEDIVEAVLKQNDRLKGASLTLRTTFQGARGRNAIVSVDRVSLERLAGCKRLNIGWRQVDFRHNQRPLVCYKCWKVGHTQKVCRSASLCGRCGDKNHVKKDCSQDPACPRCVSANLKRQEGKKLPTTHAAGSKECTVLKQELERFKRLSHGVTP